MIKEPKKWGGATCYENINTFFPGAQESKLRSIAPEKFAHTLIYDKEGALASAMNGFHMDIVAPPVLF
jgi:hypothetical protein